ncbi:unnamed protein product, partial [Symbiodinium sp. CCMP2592]
ARPMQSGCYTGGGGSLMPPQLKDLQVPGDEAKTDSTVRGHPWPLDASEPCERCGRRCLAFLPLQGSLMEHIWGCEACVVCLRCGFARPDSGETRAQMLLGDEVLEVTTSMLLRPGRAEAVQRCIARVLRVESCVCCVGMVKEAASIRPTRSSSRVASVSFGLADTTLAAAATVMTRTDDLDPRERRSRPFAHDLTWITSSLADTGLDLFYNKVRDLSVDVTVEEIDDVRMLRLRKEVSPLILWLELAYVLSPEFDLITWNGALAKIFGAIKLPAAVLMRMNINRLRYMAGAGKLQDSDRAEATTPLMWPLALHRVLVAPKESSQETLAIAMRGAGLLEDSVSALRQKGKALQEEHFAAVEEEIEKEFDEGKQDVGKVSVATIMTILSKTRSFFGAASSRALMQARRILRRKQVFIYLRGLHSSIVLGDKEETKSRQGEAEESESEATEDSHSELDDELQEMGEEPIDEDLMIHLPLEPIPEDRRYPLSGLTIIKVLGHFREYVYFSQMALMSIQVLGVMVRSAIRLHSKASTSVTARGDGSKTSATPIEQVMLRHGFVESAMRALYRHAAIPEICREVLLLLKYLVQDDMGHDESVRAQIQLLTPAERPMTLILAMARLSNRQDRSNLLLCLEVYVSLGPHSFEAASSPLPSQPPSPRSAQAAKPPSRRSSRSRRSSGIVPSLRLPVQREGEAAEIFVTILRSHWQDEVITLIMLKITQFSCGYLSSDLLQGYQVQRELKATTETLARAASQAAASRCIDALEQLCCIEDHKPRSGQKRPAGPKPSASSDYAWVWVLVATLCNWLIGGLVSLCYFCCRRVPAVVEIEEEEESPGSPVEQRALAQQQLAALLVLQHAVDEDYAVVTPDRDIFVETLSLANDDLRGLRLLPIGGAMPVGLRGGSVYRLPALTALDIAGFKAHTAPVVAAELALRIGGAAAPAAPVAAAAGADGGAGGVAAPVGAADPEDFCWVAAEASGGYKFGDIVQGVNVAAADGAKAVHMTAPGASLFVACIRGRDRDAFLRRPGGWDLRTVERVAEELGRSEAPLKDVVSQCFESPVDSSAWGIQEHWQLSNVIKHALQTDQLNGCNLLSLEVMFRRLQTIEYAYSEKAKDSESRAVGGRLSLEEQQTFGGTTRLASTLMVCPELLEHVKAEVERDASLAKNLRKAREERELARRNAKKGGKAGDDGHVVKEANLTIAALNSMYQAPAEKDSYLRGYTFDGASEAQREVQAFVYDAVVNMGQPPAFSHTGALRLLRAAGGYTDDQAVGTVAGYDPEKVSLPEAGWQPIPLSDLWGPTGRERVHDFVRHQLLPPDEAQEQVAKLGLKKLYMDPRLKDRRVYTRFLQRMQASHLVDFSLKKPCEEVAVFFVTKKGDRLRLIIADLKDAFYHLELPFQLRDYFGLPGARAKDLGITTVGGVRIDQDTIVYPRLSVVPMGWSHALYLCQSIHESLVEQAGLGDSNRLRDRRRAPNSHCAHTQYVDNLIVMGTAAAEVKSRFSAAVQSLKSAGLQVHEEETSTGDSTVLGWEYTAGGLFRPTRKRAWKARCAIRELLRRGRARGEVVERLLGHLTFLSLCRREALSVFGEIYKFVKVHRRCPEEVVIPKSILQELRNWDGILPLLFKDLRCEWAEGLSAVDASEFGLGMTRAECSAQDVKRLGGVAERWRFKEALPNPRAAAFSTVTSQCEVMPPFALDEDEEEDRLHHRRDDPQFSPVPFEDIDRAWTTTGMHRWRRPLTLPVAEVASLALCTGSQFFLRWIPSEMTSSSAMLLRGLLGNSALTMADGSVAKKRKRAPATSRGRSTPSSATAGPAQASLQLETEAIPRKLKKERRRAARQSMNRSLESQTILQQASVSPECLARYKRHWEEMEPMMLDGRGRLRALARIDQALAEHLEDLYRDGEDLATARYAVAAALFFRPELGSPAMTHLPKVKQSLAGWSKLCPPRSRLPIPYAVVALLALHALSLGLLEIAIYLLLTFSLYMRPSEGLRLRKKDVVRPSSRQAGFQHWSVVLHPLEVGVCSKTQEFDECLQLDLPYHQPLGPATYKLLRLHQKRGEEHIFTITLENVTQFLERAQIELELKGLGELQPYRLRHGGASHDFVSKLRDLASIQMRGRWRSQSSVRRYQKGGRLTQLMQTLTPHVKRAAESAVRKLPAALAGLP